MDKLKVLLNFLEKLDDVKLYYKLNKVRESIMVEIAVPRERWEVEYMEDGSIVLLMHLAQKSVVNRTNVLYNGCRTLVRR